MNCARDATECGAQMVTFGSPLFYLVYLKKHNSHNN